MVSSASVHPLRERCTYETDGQTDRQTNRVIPIIPTKKMFAEA